MSTHNNPSLEELRKKIQSVDEQILSLIGLRQTYAKEVGEIKKQTNTPPLQESQAKKKESWFITYGKSVGLRTSFVRKIWRTLHHESLRTQKQLLGDVYLLQQLENKKLKILNRSKKR